MSMNVKLEAFKKFVVNREEACDWHRFIAPSGKKLVRTKICDECQFPRSTIYQDDVIVRFLDSVERRLREQGILAISHPQPVAETMDELEDVVEKRANDVLARTDGLLIKCRALVDKLNHLSQYHSAYPVQGR